MAATSSPKIAIKHVNDFISNNGNYKGLRVLRQKLLLRRYLRVLGERKGDCGGGNSSAALLYSFTDRVPKRGKLSNIHGTTLFPFHFQIITFPLRAYFYSIMTCDDLVGMRPILEVLQFKVDQ